jgi:hypothetical protein
VPDFSPGILIYAVRYAIGRQSYASSEVAEEVLKHAPDLDTPTKGSIIWDIQRAFQGKQVSGPDQRAWEAALEALKAPTAGAEHA